MVDEIPAPGRTPKTDHKQKTPKMNAKQIVESLGWDRIVTLSLNLPFAVMLGVAVYKTPDAIDSLDKLYLRAASQLQLVAEKNAEAAKQRDETITKILDEYRRDEREDQRLFVALLKRSDMTPAELSEAINESRVDP